MNPSTATHWLALPLLGLTLLLGGCSSSQFELPEVEAAPLMVSDAGQARLWVLTKQEESRTVGVSSGGGRSSMRWRRDTLFHFQVQAFDPVTARPLWSRRLLTLGDHEAKGPGPSRVIGSSADGRLLGQDGSVVWVLINKAPFAISAADGSLLADTAALEQQNPELRGLLPTDAQHYAFDRGLVLLSADARRFVIRGPGHEAVAYAPTPPPAPPVDLMSNGRERIVPLMPMGEVPARLAQLDGQWLALYSDKEAADAANDSRGDNLRYPYRVLNEGALVRRSLWRPRVVSAQRFDDVFDRIESLDPIAGAPSFLKGRFFKDLATGRPMAMASPDGLMVWHSTRIDSAGRLALSRLGNQLETVWSTPLPMSESSTATPVMYWQLLDKVVVMGTLETMDDGVRSQEPHLASINLADGKLQAWNITREAVAP